MGPECPICASVQCSLKADSLFKDQHFGALGSHLRGSGQAAHPAADYDGVILHISRRLNGSSMREPQSHRILCKD